MPDSRPAKPSEEEVASARRILDHIGRNASDVDDNDPEFAVMKQDAEAVLRAAKRR